VQTTFHLAIPFTKKTNNVIGHSLTRNGAVFGSQLGRVWHPKANSGKGLTRNSEESYFIGVSVVKLSE